MTRKIIVSPTFSPLPSRNHDWCAYYEGEEEAGNYGYGATEKEAIADFIENCAEDHDDRLRGLVSRPNTYLPGSNADLHGRVLPTKDGHTTGPLHWVPERRTWTDPQMSDEWRPDGASMLYPGGGDLDIGPEPLTATVAIGAVNLADELARRSVEGFPLKPTCDEHGNWSSIPAHEVDGADKRVLRAAVAVALASEVQA